MARRTTHHFARSQPEDEAEPRLWIEFTEVDVSNTDKGDGLEFWLQWVSVIMSEKLVIEVVIGAYSDKAE